MDILAETLNLPVGKRFGYLKTLASDKFGMSYFSNEIGGDTVNFPDLEELFGHPEVAPDAYDIFRGEYLVVRYGNTFYTAPYTAWDGRDDSPSDYVDMAKLTITDKDHVSKWFDSLVADINRIRRNLMEGTDREGG